MFEADFYEADRIKDGDVLIGSYNYRGCCSDDVGILDSDAKIETVNVDAEGDMSDADSQY